MHGIDEALHRRMRDVKERIADSYLGRNGVTGIGVGLKLKDGRQTGTLAIFFCVRRKGRVAAGLMLPSEIEGFPTDVLEADFGRDPFETLPQADDSAMVDRGRYITLKGGISIAPSRLSNGRGTLGLLVSDAATGNAMMLSNAHVLALSDGRAAVGDEICQEARVDNSLGWCGNCATLSRWAIANVVIGGANVGVDAGVARISTILRRTAMRTIVDIGVVNAQPGEAALLGAASKRGASTGLTQGTVGSVTLDAVKASGFVMRNQIRIDPPQGGVFAASGDSGSVCVAVQNNQNRVIGLIWGALGYGVASPIDAVLQKMAVHL
jgi:endonuclease G